MTTLGRAGSALLVIDVQNGVVEGAHKLEETLAAINASIDKARATGIPVIWVQHSDEDLAIDSEAWQIVDELHHDASEPHIRKLYPSSFEGTDLESILEKLGVGHLYICGAQSNNCVRHTGHSASERGYDLTLISDAHTTTGFEWNGYKVDAERVIDEQNTNFMGRNLPGRSVRAIPASEVSF